MPLQKQAVKITNGEGLDQKTDPWQIPLGKMIDLQNAVFNKIGRYEKRFGFSALPALDNSSSTGITTYRDSLVASGISLSILSDTIDEWFDRGVLEPILVETVSVLRNNSSQVSFDSGVAQNGLSCSAYQTSTGSTFYQINDSTTGQIIVAQTALPATAISPRVFVLGSYFVITFLATVSGATHLRYIAIPITEPTLPANPVSLSAVVSGLSAGYDGVIAHNNLYLGFNGSDGGNAVRFTYIDSDLIQHGTKVVATYVGNRFTLSADITGFPTAVIYATFWNSSTNDAYTMAFNQILVTILAPTLILSTIVIQNFTSSAAMGVMTLYYETVNTYSYSSVRSDFISKKTITQGGSISSASVLIRSVGIASKAFFLESTGKNYILIAYSGAYQPTYFLIDELGNLIAKLAYSNGGGYPSTQVLPNVYVNGTEFSFGYLFKDQVVPVNKSQGVSAVAGIYNPLGGNIAKMTINDSEISTAEIGGSLHLSGGFVWQYDGVIPVELGFHVWPEDILVTTSGSGGLITAQLYYYYATYEWTDASGNVHRSAPSVPFGITTTGSTSTNTVNIPTLRLTYKNTQNPVRIVLYRWSTAQPVPYQVTPILSPLLNDPTMDSLTYTDTAADSAILGNAILYTTGGVLENIAPPACTTLSLYKSRLFLIPSEDPNNLWFSKQVVQGVPVETSDLLTLYTAPTVSSQASTGPNFCIIPMDDKAIISKQNAFYYITGTGPDSTGANDDFSEPIFITSVVGSINQNSFVMNPNGLMFQSVGKGIWILTRNLECNYIGANVDSYNLNNVTSAIAVPGTNEVRFTLDSGITLMYDYYFDQWGTFTNVPAISSTLYQDKHTYLNSSGMIYQETVGSFRDGSRPVLMSMTSGWINLAGLQGFQRAYFLYLIGRYLSPHKIFVQIAYDYEPFFTQSFTITPDNFTPAFGDDAIFGEGTPFGGSGVLEQWRITFTRGKCEAFQVKITEQYDSSLGVAPGAGFYLSGFTAVVGIKKGYPTLKPSRTIG